MKYSFLIGCLLLSAGCQTCRKPAPSAGTAIYVVLGQSLAGGFFDTPLADSPDSRIQFYRNGSWVPGQEPSSDDPASVYTSAMPFAKQMLAQNPSTPIGIVNCARGSTIALEWLPNSCINNPNLPVCGLYESCTAKIDAALQQLPGSSVAGFLVNIGQSDAHECGVGQFAMDFPGMAQSFQKRYGGVPLVFSQLGDFQDAASCPADTIDQFRSMQAGLHSDRMYMVTTLDLGTTDGVHMDTAGHQQEGARWANTMWQAQGAEECTEPWWSRIFRIS